MSVKRIRLDLAGHWQQFHARPDLQRISALGGPMQ